MNTTQWKTEGSFFNYQNYKIFYRDNGLKGKPVLVCLHGFPTSSWDWRELWEVLGNNYRLIAPDMLGFGFSDKPFNYRYRISEQANIVLALLQELGIEEFHLAAHDFATLVAQELLANIENNTDKPKLMGVFAMSGSIFPALSNPRLIQKLLISPLGPLITKLFSEQKFYRSLSAVYGPATQPKSDELKAHWQQLCYEKGHRQLHALNFFLKDRKEYGEYWTEAWQNSKVPIRYLAGESDPMYGLSGLTKLRQLSKQSDIHSLEGIGHFPHVEAPHETSKLLREFLV